MKRKCLAIGIILLFVGVTIAPTINFNTVKASNDNNQDGTYERQQSMELFTWTFIGLISRVKNDNGYTSFYTIIVHYTGIERFESTWMPIMGFSSFDTFVIPNTYKGILTNHIIIVSVLRDMPKDTI